MPVPARSNHKADNIPGRDPACLHAYHLVHVNALLAFTVKLLDIACH
jgi:hypothetical protein